MKDRRPAAEPVLHRLHPPALLPPSPRSPVPARPASGPALPAPGWWLGAAAVQTIDPEMGGEDFGQFGRTMEKVPICMFRVGAVDPQKIAESLRSGEPLPSLYSSKFAPIPEPAIKTGVTALTAAALELLAKK